MPKPILSSLPDAWGGPFIWHRNERGNLTLIPVSDLIETSRLVTDACTDTERLWVAAAAIHSGEVAAEHFERCAR